METWNKISIRSVKKMSRSIINNTHQIKEHTIIQSNKNLIRYRSPMSAMMKTLSLNNHNRSTFPSSCANRKLINSIITKHLNVCRHNLMITLHSLGIWRSNSLTKPCNSMFRCLKIRQRGTRIWISITYQWVRESNMLLIQLLSMRYSSSNSRTESMLAKLLSWGLRLKSRLLTNSTWKNN